MLGGAGADDDGGDDIFSGGVLGMIVEEEMDGVADGVFWGGRRDGFCGGRSGRSRRSGGRAEVSGAEGFFDDDPGAELVNVADGVEQGGVPGAELDHEEVGPGVDRGEGALGGFDGHADGADEAFVLGADEFGEGAGFAEDTEIVAI